MYVSRFVIALALLFSVVTPASAEEKKPDRYMQLVGDAMSYVKFEAWEEMLASSEEAIRMAPDRTHAWELRAKALLELGSYEEARSSYEKLAGLMPEKTTFTLFNIGEVYFREGKYDEALANFRRYLVNESNASKKSLAQWKILLCNLKLGREKEANQFINSLEPQPFEPIYYYAHAARDFALGSKKEAHKDLIKAYRIYDDSTNTIYAESLIHLGWLDMDVLKSDFLTDRQEKYQVEDAIALAIQGGLYHSDPTKQTELPTDNQKSNLPELPELE
jgi:tetratricopeptide (TPR) repeat protein